MSMMGEYLCCGKFRGYVLMVAMGNKRGSKVRYFTLQERIHIETNMKAGITYKKIGESIGRSEDTISSEICRFGGREKYSAKFAHKKSQQNMQIRNEQAARSHDNALSRVALTSKIEAIEMQLEIIIDMLKEIQK